MKIIRDIIVNGKIIDTISVDNMSELIVSLRETAERLNIAPIKVKAVLPNNSSWKQLEDERIASLLTA